MAENPFGRASAVRYILLITGSTYIAYASGLLVSAMAARALGPSDYGQYAYLVWLSGLANMLANHGLTGTGIRFVSESRGRMDPVGARRLHAWLLDRQRLSIILVAVALCAFVPYAHPDGWRYGLPLFASAVLVSSATKSSHLFGASMAKGHGRFDLEITTTNAMSLANLALFAALFASEAPLWAFAAGFVLISSGHALITTCLLRRADIRAERGPLEPDVLARVRHHLHWSIAAALVGAFGGRSIETYLLNRYSGSEAVAWFSVAGALTRGGTDLLMAGINSTLLTALAHAYGAGDKARFARIARDSIRYCHLMGLALAGVGILWARPLVVLIYGEKFESVEFLVQAMVGATGPTLAIAALGALLTSTDRQRERARVAMLATGFNIVIAVLLVPTYGLNGALVSFAAGLVAHFVLTARAARSEAPMPWANLLLMTAAALLAYLPAYALHRGAPLALQWLSGLVFLAALPATSLLLRVWQADDVATLQALLKRVPAASPLVEWFSRQVRR